MGTNVIYRANIKETNQPKPAAAFGRLQRKYEVLDKDQLFVVNGEVTSFVSTASAAATRMTELSAEILQLPGYGPEDITDLQDAADGLDFVEGEYRATLKTMNELSDCGQELTQTREKFIVDLRNVSSHAVLEEGYLREYSGGPGYNAAIDDVRMMLRVYRNHWDELAGKTCRTLEELDRAETVVHRMVHLLGLKNLGVGELTRTAEMRNRAFTYLVKRYDRMCRAVTFVRWDHNDADLYAPSLYANRGGSKKRSQPEKDETVQPQPAQPVIGANGPFVSTPATPAGTTAPQRLPGMPGGNPFIQ